MLYKSPLSDVSLATIFSQSLACLLLLLTLSFESRSFYFNEVQFISCFTQGHLGFLLCYLLLCYVTPRSFIVSNITFRSIIHFFGGGVIYLFIYLWLCWVFVSVRGLSPVAASGGHSSSRCAGLSLPRPLSLQSTGSRRAGSATVAHGPSRSAACGILPDQGSNLCPPHWQADSQPLRHQGSPIIHSELIFMKV